MRSFFLSQLEINPFVSEQLVRMEIAKYVSPVISAVELHNSSKIRYIRYENIPSVLTDQASEMLRTNQFVDHDGVIPPNTFYVMIIGDGSRSAVRFGCVFINHPHPQSSRAFIPLAMFAGGAETHFNMKKYLFPAVCAIESWANDINESFPGYSVKLFLSGDTHWIWESWGFLIMVTIFIIFATQRKTIKLLLVTNAHTVTTGRV